MLAEIFYSDRLTRTDMKSVRFPCDVGDVLLLSPRPFFYIEIIFFLLMLSHRLLPSIADSTKLFHPRCPLISYTLLPNTRPEPTSLRGSFRARIAFLWISSVQAAFKLQLFLAMHRQLFSVAHAMLCCANPLVDGQDSPRVAVTERRLIEKN